jgi:hypothetical protein
MPPEEIAAVARGILAPLEIQDVLFLTETFPSANRAADRQEGKVKGEGRGRVRRTVIDRRHIKMNI